jgi:PAS domain-containing protein
MNLLVNPIVMRMAMLFFAAVTAFVLALFVIRRLRMNLVAEPESFTHAPLAAEGLPVHAYHEVIQQLKQQKHELATQQLSDRRKAKASDTLSSAILSNLSCGVIFVNTSGLVRQVNPAARKLLGFASPAGLHVSDLFRSATLRPAGDIAGNDPSKPSLLPATFVPPTLTTDESVEQTLAPALSGSAAVRNLLVNYVARDGESRVLEVTASPVLAEDASLMGTTLLLTDKTDIERIRHDRKMHQEISSELALGLRSSLTTISGYAQQLACNRDADLAHHLADDIAHEAAQLDRTIGSFLGGSSSHAASTGS